MGGRERGRENGEISLSPWVSLRSLSVGAARLRGRSEALRFLRATPRVTGAVREQDAGMVSEIASEIISEIASEISPDFSSVIAAGISPLLGPAARPLAPAYPSPGMRSIDASRS